MVLKPFRKSLPVGGWMDKIARIITNAIEIDNVERMEAILEAPAQLLLQLFIISQGRPAGKYYQT